MWLTKRASASVPAPFPVQPSGHFEGNDGNWSTFLVNVGTPQATYRALVSTSSLYTWLTDAEGCEGASGIPANCPSLRGAPPGSPGWQRATTSSTYQELGTFNFSLSSSLDVVSAFGTLSPDGGAFNGGSYLGVDSVSLNADLSQGGQVNSTSSLVYGVTEPSFFLGGLGIGHGVSEQTTGNYHSLVDLLANTSQIPSLSWGYTAGAYYKNQFGSLVLGGYDKNRLQSPTAGFSMPNGGRTPLLQVSVQSITVNLPGGKGTASATTNGQVDTTFEAVIDSTLPYLYLPQTVCENLARIIGLQLDSVTGLYTINATQRAANVDTTIDILVNDLTNKNVAKAITLPYAAFDLNATWPIYGNNTSYFPIQRSPTTDPNGVHILGRTYLQEAYIIADFERNNFTIAQAVSTNSATQNLQAIHSTNQPANSNSHKLSAGAIAGIIVGAVLGLLLLALLIWWFFIRKKKSEKPEDDSVDPIDQKSRRNTADSQFSELPSAVVSPRPAHTRHVSELSSDSEHERRRTLVNPPGTIHELDDAQKVLELENHSDTTAWLRNQERMATQERVELPGDLPYVGFPDSNHASTSSRNRLNSDSGGPVSAAASTPQSANVLPLSPVSPRQRGTPIEMSPEITPPVEAERRLGDTSNNLH